VVERDNGLALGGRETHAARFPASGLKVDELTESGTPIIAAASDALAAHSGAGRPTRYPYALAVELFFGEPTQAMAQSCAIVAR
jgi:hypothetical protein